jgi:hypothetical protein
VSAHNDSAFLRMFLIVLGALVAFTIIILIHANTITDSVEEARGPDPRLRAVIAERIKPVRGGMGRIAQDQQNKVMGVAALGWKRP